QIAPIYHIPEIRPGMHLGEYLRQGLQASGWELQTRDILTVTQKVISKAEGRIVNLSSIEASAYSLSLGLQTGRDPRLIEVVWRDGLVDVAIGIARVPPFVDYRGQTDTCGRALKATLLGSVDALAAAAGLVMGKTAQTPAALIRGFPWEETDSSVAALLRPPERDLFL